MSLLSTQSGGSRRRLLGMLLGGAAIGGVIAWSLPSSPSSKGVMGVSTSASKELDHLVHHRQVSDAPLNPELASTDLLDPGSTSGRSRKDIENALPIGLTDIDGQGGTGIHRSVLRNGVWFPVFQAGELGSAADPATAPLNEIELSITSGNPPPAEIDQPYLTRFEAIGGRPPYRWSASLSGDLGFSIQPESGDFSGTATEVETLTLTVEVQDQDGSTDSAAYQFQVQSSEDDPLEITTTELPSSTVGESLNVTLGGSGGVPPYQWSLIESGVVEVQLDASSGQLQATASETGVHRIGVRLTDAGGETSDAFWDWSLSDGLEIVTRQLPAGSPGLPYEFALEAVGGDPPYQWAHVGGDLPISNGSWQLSADGLLRGPAGTREGYHQPEFEVRDATGRSFRKTFNLIVRQALIAVPSDRKVGLAWRPAQAQRDLGVAIQGFEIQREGPEGSLLVYQGSGFNAVDREVQVGGRYRYQLTAVATSGERLPYSAAEVVVLPILKTRGRPSQFGDPFADEVKVFRPLTRGGFGSAFAPGNVTGPPDGRSTFSPAQSETELLSLHAAEASTAPHPVSRSGHASGGSIILAFTDNIVENGPGTDFLVFENVLFVGGLPQYRFMEPATVSVALFEGEWLRFPTDVVPPASGEINFYDPFYYNQGFAGVNGVTGSDPTQPLAAGGDGFDLEQLGAAIRWIRFIRIESTGNRQLLDDRGGDVIEHIGITGATSGQGSSGFDLDAVGAVHY